MIGIRGMSSEKENLSTCFVNPENDVGKRRHVVKDKIFRARQWAERSFGILTCQAEGICDSRVSQSIQTR